LVALKTRASEGAFIDGVLSSAERKTGWMLAEQAGHARPYRMQSLLGRSNWSADALRDHVRDYVVDALGDPSGVLVVDETGFLKKGTHSVGVGRQYSGTAGRIENCQIGVFACYASRWGQAIEATGSFTCLGSVENHRLLMIAAQALIIAAKLVSVLSLRMAIRLNSLSLQKKFSIR